MHLSSLSLRGFKSFASATTLRFEPGITAVVGPNGSGKSNVVDAIAWVLGEQGAKALRGGKMEDVIFAGTAGRPPLGRAEVTLTIDNHDGALPIDYAEVSITRRMFRSGDSEYEINGTPCRLLDIQELLSDSGIGREMHVIVGQGQLDAVLAARPEDRRAFIEEAAGVLKHRKRKEKALRKLEAMQANLTRLTDLTAELRRQLKPLGRQAEVARRAAAVQAELRDARLRLLADDLAGLQAALEQELADEAAARDQLAAVERALAAARDRETTLESELAAAAPRLARAQETWYRLSALAERLSGTAALAGERHRSLSAAPADHHRGPDPAQLEADAAGLREREARLHAAMTTDRDRLAAAEARRADLEARLAAAERELVAAVRAVADRREGLARLAGQVHALRTRAAAADDEIARLSAALDEADARAVRATERFERLQAEVTALEEAERGLDDRHERAAEACRQARRRVEELSAREREVERDRSSWRGRRDALELSLTSRAGAGTLLGAGERLTSLLGPVAALLQVRAGYEAAVAAALDGLADAVAVGTAADATAALQLLKEDGGGRATLLVGGGPEVDRAGWPPLPPGASWVADLVGVPGQLRAAVTSLLAQVAVTDDLAAAERLVARWPQVTAVTRDGDLLGRHRAAGGSTSTPSPLEVRAALEEAAARLADTERRADAVAAALAVAHDELAGREREAEAALEALHASDAGLAAVAAQLAELGSAARSAREELERLGRARAAAEQARDRDLDGLAALEERLHAAQSAPADEEPSGVDRDRLAAEVAAARQAELDVRLAVRTGEERIRALQGRADSLARAAQAERDARERLRRAQETRARGAAVAGAVAAAAQQAARRLAGSLDRAAAEREAAGRARAELEGELQGVRQRLRELGSRVEQLTGTVHRDEVARAEQRLRIDQVQARAAEEFGVDPQALLAEYGPDRPVPRPEDDGAGPGSEPYDRAVQERRAARAERDLALLGKVNPLALEEFAALEERHAFLAAQLEDLRASRRDLLTVVGEVDERIRDVFRGAFEDTAREFGQVFATLFPGGEGRLLLTDPDDLLATGVEVEARPPGKKVKRLSLLSGGERSMTAVALLVAIFRARPSPFYVLDEVEAALDEVNLGRLIGLIEQLRESSQLIVITHQKRTMEIADALYGTSMRGDGITQVISQRLREREAV